MNFIVETSRGGLKIPHVCTHEFVQASLCFMKLSGTAICCQKQLITSLNLMNNFYKFGDFPAVFFKRLANVLLNGVHSMYV